MASGGAAESGGERTTTALDHSGRTTATLNYPHAARRTHRLRQRKSNALLLYGVALAAAAWGLPALAAVAQAGRSQHGGALVQRVLDGTGLWAPALLCLTLLLAARSARWRGPVVLELPAVQWLMPQPLDRARLLLPPLRATTVAAATGGTVVGGALGFALYAAGAGTSWPALTAAGAFNGLVAALLAVATGVMVQRYEGQLAVRP